VSLYVAGEDELALALRRELASQLQASDGFGEVRNLTALPAKDDLPTVVVEVAESDVTWLPVYASAGLDVTVFYSSNGDMSWRDQLPVIMSSDDGPIVRLKGQFEVADRTRGLTSRVAYERYLGKGIAGEVSKSLERELNNPAHRPRHL
jgi:hypothetical protein